MGNTAYCIGSFSMAPYGTVGDTSGDSQACRDYHLGAAASDAMLHCPHAGGEAVCVAEETSAEAFCSMYMDTCSMYDSFSGDMAMCIMAYEAAEMGEAGATSGDSQACRDYHLGAAASDAMLHCPHAGGEAVCVTDDTTMLPMTTMEANAAASAFCTEFMSVCSDYNTWAAADDSMMACTMAFIATPPGDPSDTFGFSQGCKVYHLGAAIGVPALHCPHAGSEAVCVSDDSAAFCNEYIDACFDHDAFEGDMASCIIQYEMAPPGEEGATEGNSRACRAYHLSAALSDPATHCSHSAGMAVCVDENSPAQTFCGQYMNTCSMYNTFNNDMDMCVMAYDYTPAGDSSDTSGNSQGCRDYHLGAAMSGDAMVHCPHAGGEAVCVDAAAATFCMAYATTCANYDSYMGMTASCIMDFTMTPMGEAGDTSGNSRSCRTYHLGAAASDAMLHCPHAGGDAVCIADESDTTMMPMSTMNPGIQFCTDFASVCDGINPYADMAECMADFGMIPAGASTDLEGNTQGCRTYHVGAAQSNAAFHCPHARGAGPCADAQVLVTSTAVVSTTAFTCPRNCGQLERGGGTCRPNGRCLSCNENRLRQAGQCFASISCRAARILTGRLAGSGCRCANSHCHYCVRAALGDECRKCRDGWYLMNEDCYESCPATMSQSGVGLWGRRCLDPFTCQGGAIVGSTASFGCKCALPDNAGVAPCHICDHRANEIGDHCTRCNGGKFLYENRCRENCDGLTGVITYSAGSFGRECRAPFTCSERTDELGARCKCGRSIGGNDCVACDWSFDGNVCSMCGNNKYLRDGACVNQCRNGETAYGGATTGRECRTNE